MQFYDAHVHFFFEGPLEPLKHTYLNLPGFLGGGFIVLEEIPQDRDRILMMVPQAYHHLVTPELMTPAEELLDWMSGLAPLKMYSYLDTRFFTPRHVADLDRYIRKGYAAVKVLYIPEEDEFIGVEGWERALGRKLSDSEQLIADLAAGCDRLNLPMLFHVDLRRYGSFTEDLVESYPNIRFNIPHFGSSRKKMADFLNRFENVYTDFSSLLPFMQQAPEAYLEFIEEFSDRVLFGSDATFGLPNMVEEYVEYIEGFLEGDLKDRVVRRNFEKFHEPL